ncbi:endonuclease domain-containing protein [Acidobacteria bacterium AH-259-A15]|nr:endonuclease domain-containing protein [Acidobacteria bacterium AH-259-A15]
MIKINIDDHLIIPFGCPKWDIKKIKIVGVSTKATYLESDTPCVHIDRTQNRAIRLKQVSKLFPEKLPTLDDSFEALSFIRDFLKTSAKVQTDAEALFLDLYFSYCKDAVTPKDWQLWFSKSKIADLPIPVNNSDWVFDALMPLPQAHLYLHDPLSDRLFPPKNMIKVDFAFWTGKHIVAVEIDGSSHVGSENHVRKDRLLQRAGVRTIHILNSELHKHREKVITELLPRPIVSFWDNVNSKYPSNPLNGDVPW